MADDEDVERVARALCTAYDEAPDNDDPRVPDWRGWHDHTASARAAIAATPLAALKADNDALREVLRSADQAQTDVLM